MPTSEFMVDPMYDSSMYGPTFSPVYSFFMMALMVFMFVTWIFVFKKAGKEWWKAIIPIYNVIVLLEIIKKPWWWLLLMFIPFVNFVIAIIVAVELAKAFGHGVGFAIGMLLLPVVFYPILAFDSSTYVYGEGMPQAPSEPAPEAQPEQPQGDMNAG